MNLGIEPEEAGLKRVPKTTKTLDLESKKKFCGLSKVLKTMMISRMFITIWR
jgi:hypothetical protein